MKTNRKYKDSVFTMLFSDPDLLRVLYSALSGVTLPPDAPVIINTLEKALFLDKYNDISFEIGGKLVVLIEHQSTINENLPLRMLQYIGRVYEKILDKKKIYQRKQLKIPRPEFYVLYNGTEPFPDQMIYRLSDAFEKNGLEEENSLFLELEVIVININEGRNQAVLEHCKKLSEYCAFIAKVRAFIEELGKNEEAIEKAIKFCEKHDILREFLNKHGSEVLGMLYAEWNLDDALAVRYEEGVEYGREEGREEGQRERSIAIARSLLSKGSSVEFVQEITGLDLETIKGVPEKTRIGGI